jgi:hypothetical protein
VQPDEPPELLLELEEDEELEEDDEDAQHAGK